MKPVFARVLPGLFFLLTASCSAPQSPPLPDLGAAQDGVFRRTVLLQGIEESTRHGLQTFAELQIVFNEIPAQLYEPPFPLHLFRYVLMSCLNQEMDTGSEMSPTQREASYSRLQCKPPYLDELLQDLQRLSSERAETAMNTLLLIDEMRRLRATLRDRLVRMPTTLNTNKVFLADQQAELRQQQADLGRRRALYTRADWNEANERFNAYQQALDAYSIAIVSLERSFVDWQGQLTDQVNALYMDVAALR